MVRQQFRKGNELLEAWRRVLIDLKNRGLTRTLLRVTDDFSGLYRLLQDLYPHAYHQLCTVHLLRNAQRHLSPQPYVPATLRGRTEAERQSC